MTEKHSSKTQSEKSEIEFRLKKIRSGLKKYLEESLLVSSNIEHRSFYAETFFAAGLDFIENEKAIVTKLQENYFAREKKHASLHEEFNTYALSFISKENQTNETIIALKKQFYRELFLRKVSNWVFLRSYNRLKSEKATLRALAKAQLYITYIINRSDNYITDNTIRSFYKKNISSQYHNFATLILGEVALNCGLIEKEMFNKAYEKVSSQVNKSVSAFGRGEKQIFGYVSLLYCAIINEKLNGFSKKNIQILQESSKLLSTYQEESGKIPLILSRSEKEKESLRHSYNNDLDYNAFAFFYISRTLDDFHKLP